MRAQSEVNDNGSHLFVGTRSCHLLSLSSDASAWWQGKLYAGICSSMGLVHFAKDKNPRAVYEAVQGGLPAFISQEAQVSPDLEAAPFIQVGTV